MVVKDWQWRRYTAASGKEMVTVTYYGNFFESVTEYLCLLHGGYAGDKAVRTLLGIARRVGADIRNPYDLDEVVSVMSAAPAPNRINRQKDGKFYRVTARYWDDEQTA